VSPKMMNYFTCFRYRLVFYLCPQVHKNLQLLHLVRCSGSYRKKCVLLTTLMLAVNVISATAKEGSDSYVHQYHDFAVKGVLNLL